MTQLVLAELSL